MSRQENLKKLNKKTVDSIPPGTPGGTWHADSDLRGFYIVSYATGAKVFWVRYRTPRGQRRVVRIGRFGELTPEEAREKARSVLSQAILGPDPAEERKRSREIPTFADPLPPEPLTVPFVVNSLHGDARVLLDPRVGQFLFDLRQAGKSAHLRQIARALAAVRPPGRPQGEPCGLPWNRREAARGVALFLKNLDRRLCRIETAEGLPPGTLCRPGDELGEQLSGVFNALKWELDLRQGTWLFNTEILLFNGDAGQFESFVIELLFLRSDRRLFRGKIRRFEPKLTELEKRVLERLPDL